MDLIEPFLVSVNGQEYIEIFRNHNIGCNVLGSLRDEDLQYIGVDKADIRRAILRKSANTVFHNEKPRDISVTKEYAEVVLHQIAHQLYLNNSLLSGIKNNVLVCNFKLEPTTKYFLDCIDSLEKELKELDNEVPMKIEPQPLKSVSLGKIFVVAGLTSVTALIIAKLVKDYVMKS